jgi:short-subunit dehydrogenase
MSKGNLQGRTALITGASSGFGVEFARLFARDGYNLVLVARSEGKLNDLAATLRQRHGIRVTVLPKDLTDPAAAAEIGAELDRQGIEVDALVNNAGFATYGTFSDIAPDADLDLVKVNILALTALTKRFLPGMVARRRGQILNVASTAAFQPGPLMAAYYASKAYVLFLSEGIAEEVRGSGVTVTALCPGPSRTGFQERAAMQESKLVNGRSIMDAATVARIGYQALQKGQTVVVPGLINRLMAQAPRVTPRALTLRIVKGMQERVAH